MGVLECDAALATQQKRRVSAYQHPGSNAHSNDSTVSLDPPQPEHHERAVPLVAHAFQLEREG